MTAIISSGLLGVTFAFFILWMAIGACILYFMTLHPFKNRSTEEAVRYIRDHATRKHRNDDLVAFARSHRERLMKVKFFNKTTGIVLTVIVVISVIWNIVSGAIHGGATFIYDLLLIPVILFVYGFYLFVRYINNSYIRICKNYLDEVETHE